jgi:hypothetical protein
MDAPVFDFSKADPVFQDVVIRTIECNADGEELRSVTILVTGHGHKALYDFDGFDSFEEALRWVTTIEQLTRAPTRRTGTASGAGSPRATSPRTPGWSRATGPPSRRPRRSAPPSQTELRAQAQTAGGGGFLGVAAASPVRRAAR